MEVPLNTHPDLFCFCDHEDFVKDYKYDPSAIVYSKNKGKDFSNGVRIVWDDSYVVDLIKVFMPFARVDLHVDHLGVKIKVDTNDVLTDDNVLNDNTDEDDLDVSETSGKSEIDVFC